MDANDSYRNLSEKDILYELIFERLPVLNDRELEAGYGACKKYIEFAKTPTLLGLRLLFDIATRLGYKDEAVQIALQASTYSEEMFSALGENTSIQPKKEEKKKKKKKKKKPPFGTTHQQVAASSSHPKEFEKEQRTFAASASSMTKKSIQCISIRGSESLPLKNQHKEAAPAQVGVVYVPPRPHMDIPEDMEVGKGERFVFACISNLIQGRHGYDWYRLDLTKKECTKISGRLEWGGMSVEHFSVATAGSIIYILGGIYPASCDDTSELDKSCCNDVFYLDVHHPRDGWKAGPPLPSPFFYPVATSMNDTVYFFNSKYVFARALDTSDSESSWKSLASSPNLESPLCVVNALPDPIRDRILLLSSCHRFFAYYPSKEELESIDSNQMPYDVISSSSTIMDGVIYYIQCGSGLLCAYDLDQQKNLTPEYSFKVDIVWDDDWHHLLDLGGGKLCLVRFSGRFREDVILLKFEVQKEVGGDKVHITVVSVEVFRILEDGSSFQHSVAL